MLLATGVLAIKYPAPLEQGWGYGGREHHCLELRSLQWVMVMMIQISRADTEMMSIIFQPNL